MSYPSLTVSDGKVDELMGECPCEMGDVLTGKVKLKVTSMSDQRYGKSLSFDVLSLDLDQKAEQEEEAKEAPEEAADEEKPAKSTKRNPAMDALMEDGEKE
jgi:hypothetical protein